jgi:hypothetical protein
VKLPPARVLYLSFALTPVRLPAFPSPPSLTSLLPSFPPSLTSLTSLLPSPPSLPSLLLRLRAADGSAGGANVFSLAQHPKRSISRVRHAQPSFRVRRAKHYSSSWDARRRTTNATQKQQLAVDLPALE